MPFVEYEDLIQEVYPQMRQMAARLLRQERDAHTLHRTDLVHEAFLKVLGSRAISPAYTTRDVLALAAHHMRHILVDYARRRNAGKRGSALSRVPLLGVETAGAHTDEDAVLALNQALERLRLVDARVLSVIELKFFAGYSNRETAAILELSTATIEADWQFGRLWLFRELRSRSAWSSKIPNPQNIGVDDIGLAVDQPCGIAGKV